MARRYTLYIFVLILLYCPRARGTPANKCSSDADCHAGGICALNTNEKCECPAGTSGHFCENGAPVNIDTSSDTSTGARKKSGTKTTTSKSYATIVSSAVSTTIQVLPSSTASYAAASVSSSNSTTNTSTSCDNGCIEGQGNCKYGKNQLMYCECELGFGGEHCELSEAGNFDCPKKLTINSNQLKASSEVNQIFAAGNGLLFNLNSWCGRSDDANAYLEIRLSVLSMIIGLEMQGDAIGWNYVREFKMNVSQTLDGAFVEGNGTNFVQLRRPFTKIFVVNEGNATNKLAITTASRSIQKYETFVNIQTHPNMINEHVIFPYVVAVRVRLVVINFSGIYPCMRIRLSGCPAETGSPQTCFETLGIKYAGSFPDHFFFGQDDIAESQPHAARLDAQTAWCTTSTSDLELGVTVSQRPKKVVGIITQGLGNSWVTSYKFGTKLVPTYSTAAGTEIMRGNNDGKTVVTHFLDSPIFLHSVGRKLTIWPETWNNDKACMRFELIACDSLSTSCLSNPCLNAGTCTPTTSGYTCNCKASFTGSNCETFTGECGGGFDVMSAIEKVKFSNQKTGFTNYSLSSTGAWCTPDGDNSDPWLELVFQNVVKIVGVTVGGFGSSTFSNFKVGHKLQGYSPWNYGTVLSADFLRGVTKPGDIVTHYFDSVLEALHVKFEFVGHSAPPKCSQVDIIGCVSDYCSEKDPCYNGGICQISHKHVYNCFCVPGYEGKRCQFKTQITGCLPSLGVGSKERVPASKMSSSTKIDDDTRPKFGRISEVNKAFCAEDNDPDPYLKISFDSATLVVALQMKGHPLEASWVTEFELNIAESFMKFVGNVDNTGSITRYFYNNISLSNFKIHVDGHSGRKCMRVELFGINNETLSTFKVANSSEIEDSHITASTFDQNGPPNKARFSESGWCAHPNDTNPHLMIHLQDIYTINIIVTKGVSSLEAWVKSYYLDYYNGIEWLQAKIRNERRTLSGNFDQNTPHYHFFETPIRAKKLKIHPEEWHKYSCMRIDFWGCKIDPCETCNLTVANCSENTNWKCVCHEGLDLPASVCKAPLNFANASNNFTVVTNASTHSSVVTSSSIHSVPSSSIAPTASSSFVLASSTVPPPPGPCASAMCHQNATCAVSGEVAVCTCNSGFTGDGRNCNESIHGNWTTWSDWSACPVTCGSGIITRSRECSNPAPAFGGDPCVGVDNEIIICETGTLCAGEAGYGAWSEWSPCNATCRSAYQSRNRTCKNEGLACTAKSYQSKPCSVPPCPVDGGYTEWGNWSACSKTCGSGVELRVRECTNPSPAHGGAACDGLSEESKECILVALCPGDFGFGEWSDWSECSHTCGPGTHTRSRACSIPDPGDSFCQGETSQSGECNLVHCPIDGGLTDWSAWSTCSRTCGVGRQVKRRYCTNPEPKYGGERCAGRLKRLQDCELVQCSGDHNYTQWSEWSPCSVSCASGTQSKTRQCLDASGDGCSNLPMETKECLMPSCPVDGNFTEWGEWSVCTVTCGSGLIQRTRECSNPAPAYNGSDCLGLNEEKAQCSVPAICSHEAGFTVWSPWSACSEECSFGESERERTCTDSTLVTCNGTSRQNLTCYAGPCPVDGGYSDWQPWTLCSGTCGSGLQTHSRTCTNPEPAYDGAGCLGPSEETQDCQHAFPCSGESGYEEWSQWTLCTQTCGTSIQIRTRTCRDGVDPSECSSESTQTKPCDKGPCPVHGGWSLWSSWGVCSASCGSGVKERTRTCTSPVTSYGGLSCFENSHDYQACVQPVDCPGDDELSEWGNWGACSVSCGEGNRRRSRYCTVVPRYPPPEVAYCTEPAQQTIDCYNEPCLVDGNFTLWTDWSACTTSCGFGTRTRYRNCTNPPPMFGGSDCLGPLYEMKECENATDCPDDVYFSTWASWGECSSGCEGVMYKSRNCQETDATLCESTTNVSISCEPQLCPVNGGWSTWAPWSLCSKTCGHQEEVRTRVCDNPVQRNGGEHCEGHDIEVFPCNDYDYVECPDPPPAEWSDWSWWGPCTTSCGGGHQERFRLCNNPPPAPGYALCVGERNQAQDCNAHPCPIHGNYTEWSLWTECTKECGNGTRVRGRACINPKPEHGGDPCEGDGHELNYCNVHYCPIHGGFTQWTPWMYCNKPCGGGVTDRKRSCTNPTPMYGGRNCTGLSYEANDCNMYQCSPANIRLDVTFNSATEAQYQADVTAFQNSVTDMITSIYPSFAPTVSFISCATDPPGVTGGPLRCRLDLQYASVGSDELVLLQDKLLLPNTQTTLNSLTSTNVFSSPLVLVGTAVSSTSITAEWQALPSAAVTSDTSTLEGYVLFYKRTSEDRYQKIGVAPGAATLTEALQELRKFTPYRLVVCPYSEKGNGIPSEPVTVETLEDVPSLAPVILNISSPTFASLKLSWMTIDDGYWHGIKLGYCVKYVARGSGVSNTEHVTSIAQLETVLQALNHYTRYDVYVSGKTSRGCGAEASTSFRTLEYVPSEPPQNVNATSLSSTVGIRVTWDEVRPEAKNGIIRGYNVSYTSTDGVVKWIHVNDSDGRDVVIAGLRFLTEYKVTVLAYTSVGNGPVSTEISITTEESTPARAPELVEAGNTSSSSIYLKWTEIDEQYHQGTLLGYRIYYWPTQTSRKELMVEIANTTVLEYELNGLFWWWRYDIYIGGYTKIGTGVTLNVTVRTDEEVPSRYPEKIRGVALTTTSMAFQWDRVYPGFIHGIPTGYKLRVIETDNPSNEVASLTIPYPERYHYVEGLKKYTNYTMWVSVLNRKGEGPVNPRGNINSTGEDGPEVPPDNIRASTLEHISEIRLEWERIPPEYHNGILRGYYIEYTATVIAGEVVPTDKRAVQSKRIRGNRYSAVLADLDPGSTYEIKIFGYTTRNGTKSNITIAETCRCPKYLRANWWVLPPYTNVSNPESPGGIFFMVANEVIDEMCGTCTNGHGRTEFCYEEGCDKKRRRRSTSNSYQRNSLQAVSVNVGDSCEVSFPVQGNRYVTTYAGVFPYISVVDAPGSAYFTVKNVPSTAEVVVNASLACLPLVLLMIFFAWIAGIIIWVLERKENTEHFPESFTRGVPEGFWWAYISMTTVGYGDRSPVTIPGRIFAIFWVLMGLVIISIVTGGIVTSITSVLVVQEDKIYGAQVGAIVNSSEYTKAVRQNADVVPYKNMEDIISAMHNKEVAGALLDMYAAATMKTMFEGGDIQLNRLVEYPTGYGFVLSGDMAKAAPLLRQALSARKTKVSEIVEENTDSISLDRNEADEAKEKTSGLFDANAEAFKSSFKITMILLSLVIIAGLIWHFGRYRRKEKSKQSLVDELEEKIPSFRVSQYLKSDGRQTLEEFKESLQKEISKLKNKQIRERKKTWLYKAEKERRLSSTSTRFNDLRKSTARVSPEVNTAFVEEDTVFHESDSGTSPRQSSLSSFNEFRRKKSGQVYPLEHLASTPQNYSSQTTLADQEHSM